MNAEAGGEPRPAAPDGSVTPGELLRAERERRSMTVQQAAEDLHLDRWMLEALEANRFLALGAPVYAKGHLRKYASLLGLSPESIIERYEALSDTPAVPTPIPTTVAAPARPERRSMKVPLWIGIALLVAAVAWGIVEVWTSRSGQTSSREPAAPVTTTDASPAVEAAPAASTPPPVAAPPTEERKAPVSAAPRAPSDTVAAAAPATSEVAAGNGVVRLRLEFSETSWTEIYDANGNRIMYDMGAPGRVRSVSGTAPLRVTLGYASGVTMQVNDRPLVIPRRAGKDAAKFTVAADGSVNP